MADPLESQVEPIGDEPAEVSLRWARVDAGLRGISVADALADRAAALADLAGSMHDWEAAITEVDDGHGARDAVEFATERDATIALVTAWNPMTVELPAAENGRRDRLLVEEFRPPWRSVGRSPDGSWAEAGVAMPMGPRAIECGQRFGQAAIYVVSPAGREVVVLVGAPPARLDRWARGGPG